MDGLDPLRLRPDEPAAPAEDGVPLYVGMAVQHRKFGQGELLGWEGSGATLKLHLKFPTAGAKTILARFCEPV